MSSTTCPFQDHEWVRLIGDPQRHGTFEGIVIRAGRTLARIRFADGLREIPIGQVERVVFSEEPIDLLRSGRFSGPERLRQVLAHIRLNGRLADLIYSMEATNTEFHPHQFKPVLKMLASPTGSLLIADEVGLGKTIEAGLIWTELQARYDYDRLLVVCPKVLCEKWELELKSKFGLRPRILSAAGLLSELRTEPQNGFVAVCSLQGLRPPRDWRDSGGVGGQRASAQLAKFLEENEGDEPLFDLLVIDESHHLRNTETQSNLIARRLAPVAQNTVLLSATPIHLRNKDLFALLNLVDPDTYREPTVLEEIVTANRPLIEAREALLSGKAKNEVLQIALQAQQSPLLAEAKQIATIIRDLNTAADALEVSDRAHFAGRFEQANLLANTVNRTRRRDVEGFRIIRHVEAYPATMHEVEREVYDAITDVVHRYAFERDISAGFLLATPQRLLASCLPAAIEHWRQGLRDQGDEDQALDDSNGNDAEVIGPLVAELARASEKAPARTVLEANDSKFEQFEGAVREFLRQTPEEKVIVFSSFRPTLEYLARRLNSLGIGTITVHGGTSDRSQAIDEFRSSDSVRILLSSEVSSEGVDLQFCRVVINYDLPWNPMRVEQRIGRVDRLGQASETVSVVNLYHRGTIDERIYTRLYERLKLCENALGGFEAVLGEEIRQLTPGLLTGRLSSDEIDARLEQTSQALENRRKIEEELESEAAGLIAHGDQILQSIHAARDQYRWITSRDLAQYLRDAIGRLFPGSAIRALEEEDQYVITLSQEARNQFRIWTNQKGAAGGRFVRGIADVRCHIGRPTRDRYLEQITQSHPFVRFIAERVNETEAPKLRPAVAARLRLSPNPASEIGHGRYVVIAQLWHFGGVQEQERIAYAGLRLETRQKISETLAEELVRRVGFDGELWSGAAYEEDTEELAKSCEQLLLDDLSHRFNREADARVAEYDDRAAIQLATLDRRIAEQKQRLQETIKRQLILAERDPDAADRAARVVRMNEGRIRILDERAEARRQMIENNRVHTQEAEQLAVALIEVVS